MRHLKIWFLRKRIALRLRSVAIWPQWLRVNISQYVENFAKDSLSTKSTKEQKELKQNLRLRISHHIRGDSLVGPFRDASYTISLYRKFTYNNSNKYDYLACIGFDISEDKIIVKQIQGKLNMTPILGLFKWERMLLAILTDWAKRNGFEQVRVIQAKNQAWYHNGTEDRKKRMFLHYDVTAKRSGFIFDQDRSQYVKVLA